MDRKNFQLLSGKKLRQHSLFNFEKYHYFNFILNFRKKSFQTRESHMAKICGKLMRFCLQKASGLQWLVNVSKYLSKAGFLKILY